MKGPLYFRLAAATALALAATATAATPGSYGSRLFAVSKMSSGLVQLWSKSGYRSHGCDGPASLSRYARKIRPCRRMSRPWLCGLSLNPEKRRRS